MSEGIQESNVLTNKQATQSIHQRIESVAVKPVWNNKPVVINHRDLKPYADRPEVPC